MSKSKEEILDETIPDASDNFQANYRDEVFEAMELFAKQECINLLNYIFNNWRDTVDSGNPEELYELYQQSNK